MEAGEMSSAVEGCNLQSKNFQHYCIASVEENL